MRRPAVQKWPSRRHSKDQDDEGAILIIVLVFLVFLGIIIGTLLGAASAAEDATSAQNTAHADDYAADAGIEYGVEQLETNPNWCPNSGTGTTTATPHFNNTQVTVTCDTTSGQVDSVSNWAVVSFDPDSSDGVPSLSTQSGGGATKFILGPTYVSGTTDLKTALELDATTQGDKGGTMFQFASSCPGGLTKPVGLTGNWQCTTASPNVNPALPAAPPGAPKAEKLSASCDILYPGTYNAAPALTTDNYMTSGVYYFNNVGQINLVSNHLFGGQPSTLSGEQQVITSSSPCSSDVRAGAPGNGTGVEIILGGNSWINADKGDMELYSRQPLTTVNEGTPGLSLRTVPTGASGGWNPSTLGNTTNAFTSNTGANPHIAIHGFIYLPNASIFLWATNTSQAEVLGGVSAWDIAMQASASGDGLVVETQTSPTIRTTKLTAVVQYGAKSITATAAVEVENSATRSVTVDSWTVNNP